VKTISKSIDIFIVIISTLIMGVLAILAIPARIVTIPLVLLLPGYALLAALFPKRSLGFAETFVFTLCLSLIVVMLGGFILNLLPPGLNTISWAIFSGCFTLTASAIALIRRARQNFTSPGQPHPLSIALTTRQALFLGLAGVVVCAAIVLSIVGAKQQPRAGFTQLWMLPTTGKQTGASIQLGMNNQEATIMNYTLTVDMNGKVVKTWSSIHLGPDMQWNTTLRLDRTGIARSTKVEAMLYRNDAPTKIYRHVVLWLNP
jgi:uncharacterized membrane protein